jgi:putative ABC transport system permease protein
MFRATLKSLLSRKLRLTLSALAVVLGVMFVSGAFVLTDTLGKSFDNLFASVNENIDVQVTAKPKVQGQDDADIPSNMPAALVDNVKAVPGVKTVTPGVFTAGARLVGKNGKVLGGGFGPPQFGSNWNGEDTLVKLREGRGPQSDDEVAMDAATAKSSKYKVGQEVPILTLEAKARKFKLVGVFGYAGNRDSIGGAQVIAFTTPVAQRLLLGEPDVYSQIDVVRQDGVSRTELRDDIKAAVSGSDYEVRTREEVNDANSADIQEFLKFFNYILLGFAAVALFVGIFLILNTFSMLVAQRTRELALFRAIGASRNQVINSVLIEATVIGLIASVIGLATGIGIGALLAWVFANQGGSNIDIALGVPPAAVIASFAVGLGVTLIAALFPAIRASRIPPVAAMRDAATPDKPLTTITIAGGTVFAIGAAVLGAGLTGVGSSTTTLWLILAGVLVSFIGVALLTPIISRPVVSLLGRAFSWSIPGKLGRRNSARNPRRTAVTAAALMVSIALVTGVSTVLASATKSISKAVNEQLNAELIIAGQQTGPIPPSFDKAVLEKTEQLSGVKEVAAFSYDSAKIEGKNDFAVVVNNLASVRHVLGLKPKSGNFDRIGDNEVVVDDQTAKDKKVKLGDTITAQFMRGGEKTFTITGIYEHGETQNGFLFPPATSKNFRTDAVNQGFIKLDPAADVAKVEAEVDALLKDSPEVSVQDQSAFVKQTTSIFDTILVMIQILLALAIVIAVLGIINTLALSVIERTRELGLLRAVGLRRSQAMRMITVESVVISVFGALLGVVVGVGLGAAVVQALKEEGFTDMALPWGQMATYLVLSAVIGVIAAILPAIRAARLNVLNAIAYE